MLEHPRLELVGLPLDRVAVDVDAPQQHLLRAHDLDVQAGDRQAPLLVHPLPVGLDDLRVEHDHRVVAEVPHEHLLLHADLRGGQRQAVVAAVERAEHLVDEADGLAVDVGDGRGLGLEHGVAEGADLLGHVCQATDGMPHYFDESPATGSAEATVHVELPDTSFTLRTDRGVFSHGRLDAGHGAAAARRARAAADAAWRSTSAAAPGRSPWPSPGRAPGAEVWAVDVNERARALCAANAAANGLANVVVAAPDDVPADVRFDVIWSNPPIRIGKPALHELLAGVARPPHAGRPGRARRAQAPRRRLAAAVADRRRAGRPRAWRRPRATASSTSTPDPATRIRELFASVCCGRASRPHSSWRKHSGQARGGSTATRTRAPFGRGAAIEGPAELVPRRRRGPCRRARAPPTPMPGNRPQGVGDLVAAGTRHGGQGGERRQAEQPAPRPAPARPAGRDRPAAPPGPPRGGAGTSARAAARRRRAARRAGRRARAGPSPARPPGSAAPAARCRCRGTPRRRRAAPGAAPPRCRRTPRPAAGGSSSPPVTATTRPAGGRLELLAQPGHARLEVGERRPAAVPGTRPGAPWRSGGTRSVPSSASADGGLAHARNGPAPGTSGRRGSGPARARCARTRRRGRGPAGGR